MSVSIFAHTELQIMNSYSPGFGGKKNSKVEGPAYGFIRRRADIPSKRLLPRKAGPYLNERLIEER
jgi:hypothetical protein